MSDPLITVILTTYKGAECVREAVGSVLKQTYANWELIIVDDASPDETPSIVNEYSDPRIRYFRHQENRGAMGAWITGLSASRGDLIACLDHDDAFHPDKLLQHVRLRRNRPGAGLTYNGRFETGSRLNDLREIWQPPNAVTLLDLVLGFPFAPSDMVLSREWAFHDSIWDDSAYASRGEEVVVNGSEIVYCGRLFLAGCEFASIPFALNYRRHVARRALTDLAVRCRSELACQRAILEDPLCPAGIRSESARAFTNTYLTWTSVASWQGDWALAQQYLSEAARLTPAVLLGRPAPVVLSLLGGSLAHDEFDHEQLLRGIFDALDFPLQDRRQQLEWAIARGYLLKGTRAIMWQREDAGRALLEQAAKCNVQSDEPLLGHLAAHLLYFQREFGADAADEVLARWRPHLVAALGPRSYQVLAGWCGANLAFERYRGGDYANVPGQVLRAVWNDRRYARNRGMLSIMARSLAGIVRNTVAAR
jgi:hypothetical protein